MLGTICKWDILVHPFVTIRCFGWQVFFRALVAARDQTFLSLLVQTGVPQQVRVIIPELVGRCVKLEKQAKRIYEWLAGRFMGHDPVREFFEKLARQEETHAELLELCREVASRVVWKEEYFTQWRDAVPRLERQMEDAESSLGSLDSVSDALRLVIQIESSEINQVFLGIVAAADSDFVRKLGVFHEATATHIAYISQRIPELEPGLAQECEKLHGQSTL